MSSPDYASAYTEASSKLEKLHPGILDPKTALGDKFRKFFRSAIMGKDQEMKNPEWPIILADRVARTMQLDNSPTVSDSDATFKQAREAVDRIAGESAISRGEKIEDPGYQKVNEPVLHHLATDQRLETGSVLVDRLGGYSGKGKLTLSNGLEEDAYVKVVLNNKLAASFYVKSRESFTYSTIPDGSYVIMFCTGYGWDSTVKDFTRGRNAQQYDAPLTYSTRRESDTTGTTTYTTVIKLTLNAVPGGNTHASGISLAEFDRIQ